jgi:hypothetical protein
MILKGIQGTSISDDFIMLNIILYHNTVYK